MNWFHDETNFIIYMGMVQYSYMLLYYGYTVIFIFYR